VPDTSPRQGFRRKRAYAPNADDRDRGMAQSFEASGPD